MASEPAQDEYVIVGGGGMGSYGQGVPQASPQLRADFIDKIKPEEVVEVVRMRLLGKEYLNNVWVEVAALKDRKLTEFGAWEISNLLLGIGNITTSISKYNDREIKERVYRIAKATQILLLSNWKGYGITNVSQFYYVHNIVFSIALSVLKQADAASIQELLKGTITEHRQYTNMPEKERLGQRVRRALGL